MPDQPTGTGAEFNRNPTAPQRELARYGGLSATRWTHGATDVLLDVEAAPSWASPEPLAFKRPMPGTSSGLFLISPKDGAVDGYTVRVYRLVIAQTPGDADGVVVEARAVLAAEAVVANDGPTLVVVPHYGDMLACRVEAITPHAPLVLPFADPANGLLRFTRWA